MEYFNDPDEDDISRNEDFIKAVRNNGLEENKLQMIAQLLHDGANINFKDANRGNSTSLHFAINKKELKIIRFLVENKCDINIKNNNNVSPLELAQQLDRQDIVKILMESVNHQASVEVQKDCHDYQHIQAVNHVIPFVRRDGTAGLSGQLYEIKLAMLFLFQGTVRKSCAKIEHFYLAANMYDADDFDDIVFRYKYRDKTGKECVKIIFLQAKHKEHPDNAKELITIDKLVSTSEKGDFSLKKYFSSYLKIRKHFSKENLDNPIFQGNFEELDCEFILYTNAFSKLDQCSHLCKIHDIAPDDILVLGNSHISRSYYTLHFQNRTKDEMLELLRYSCDCRKLAFELAKYIFFDKEINVDSGLLKDYHFALANEIIEIDKHGSGRLKTDFLEGTCQFKCDFYDEIQKLRLTNQINDTIEELVTWLRNKIVKLPKSFGHIKDKDAKLPLPSEFVTEKDVHEFFRKFKLFTHQPNEVMLGDMLEKQIEQIFSIEMDDVNLIFCDVKNKIQKWWKNDNIFLTECDQLFYDSKQNISKLSLVGLALHRSSQIENYSLQFMSQQIQYLTDLINQNQVINIVTDRGATLLSAAKIYQTLKGITYCNSDKFEYKFIFVSLNYALSLKDRLIDAFNGKGTDFLIIESKQPDLYKDFEISNFYANVYKIIDKQPNKKVIIITEQGECLANILRNVFSCLHVETDKNINLSDLTYESQSRLLENCQVSFQGKCIGLGALINKMPKHIINSNILASLINNELVEFVNEERNLCIDAEHYIQQTLNRQIKIRNDIKIEKDIFFILYTSVDKVIINPTQNQDIVVISDIDHTFNELCKMQNGLNVHWLMKVDNILMWQQSHGNVSKLRSFIDEKYSINYSSEQVMNINEKLVIVAAEPGMGKSTLFTHLTEITKKYNPTMWVVRVNLNKYTRNLERLNLDNDAYMALDFLMSIKNIIMPLEREIFKLMFFNTGGIVLLFDGFDEISPNYKDKVILLIQILMKTKVDRIWVSTRPHLQIELENLLCTFSYTLQPFSRSDQELYLKEYWKQNLKNVNITEDRLKMFSEKLLGHVHKSIHDKETKFSSVPLQLKMLAETFQDAFEIFNSSGGVEFDHLLPKKLNLLNLYDKFVESKYKKHYLEEKLDFDPTKPGSEYKLLYNSFQEKHRWLSLKALFSDVELNLHFSETYILKIEEIQANIIKGEDNIGLIHNVIDNKPYFIHRTYAEYFASQWFALNFKKYKVRCFLQKHIFKEENSAIRNFFDHILANDPSDENKYEMHNSILANDKKSLCKLLDNGHNINNIDIAGRTALHLACSYGYKDMVEILLERNAHIGLKENIFSWSPLSFADLGKFWNIAEMLLLKQADGSDMFEAIHSAKCNSRSQDGRALSLLDEAAILGLLELTKVLVEIGKANIDNKDFNGRTSFQVAACNGKLEIMEYLMKRGANVQTANNNNETSLHLAAKRGRLNSVKFLLDKTDCDLNCKNKANMTPLHFALYKSEFAIVKEFIERGADCNVTNGYGSKPLHIAVQYSNLSIIKFLVNAGARVNFLDKEMNGKIPLHFAAYKGKLDIVEYFVKENVALIAIKDDNGNTSLHLAAEQNKWAVVEYLVNQGADCKEGNSKGNTPLHWAVRDNKLQEVDYLVKKGADINKTNEDEKTPLHWAASSGHLEIARYLIANKADVNINDVDNRTPLLCAAEWGSWDVVKCLIDNGANCNVFGNDGMTPLYWACYSDQFDTVEYLVANRANLNFTDIYGRTPLHGAAFKGSLKILKYLILEGADYMAVDTYGSIAIHRASVGNSLKVIKYLVEEKNVDFMLKDGKGRSSLHLAAKYGHMEIVVHLVGRGADLWATDKNDRTPLFGAVSYGNMNVIDYLVDNGADVNAKDINGLTPLHIATYNGAMDVIKYLIKYGANINAMAGKNHYSKSPLDFSYNPQVTDYLKANGAVSTKKSCSLNSLSNTSTNQNLFIKVVQD